MIDPTAGTTVVLGVGSPLMADDGLGLTALERVRGGWEFEPDVQFVDGGTWSMNVLPVIEDANRLLLIDAIRAGRTAGTVVVLEREQLPRFFSTKISPHQIDLRETLALAELRGTLPEQTVAIGLEPARVEMSTELSPEVEVALPQLELEVIDRLRSWGHSVRRREGSASH
jgi:hydrogenase maturation protease